MNRDEALKRLESIEKETQELKAIISKPDQTIREQVEALPLGTLFELTWNGRQYYRIRTNGGFLHFNHNEFCYTVCDIDGLSLDNTNLRVITLDQLRKALNDR